MAFRFENLTRNNMVICSLLIMAAISTSSGFKQSCLALHNSASVQVTYVDDTCFILHAQQFHNQTEANTQCGLLYKDGHLASIRNKQQMEKISSVLDLSSRSRFYESTYPVMGRNISNSSSLWAHNQSASGGDGVMTRYDGLVHAQIDSLHPFICQLSQPRTSSQDNPQVSIYSPTVTFKGSTTNGKANPSENAVMLQLSAKSLHQCGEACKGNPDCLSFAFSSGRQECHLYWLSAAHFTLDGDTQFKTLLARQQQDTDCLSHADCWQDLPKLLLISGDSVTSLESYHPTDPSRNEILANYGSQRKEPQAALVNGKVIIAGNRHGDAELKKNLAIISKLFDPKNNTLEDAGDTVQPRHGPGMATLNGVVIMCGGAGEYLVDLVSCERYVNGQWSTMAASMTYPRRHLSLTNLHNKLYAVGGVHFTTFVGQVEVFDGTSWSILADQMPTPRYDHGATVFRDELVICGGHRAGINRALCHSYNDVADQWSSMPSMTTVRSSHGLVAFFGKMYAVGGLVATGTSVEVYDPETDQWSMMATATIEQRIASAVIVV